MIDAPAVPRQPRAPQASPAAAPGAMVFVRMKLRMIGNGLRGSGRQTATFVFSCLFGAFFAIIGCVVFAALTTASQRTALSVSGLIGAVIVVGWLLLPTLYFGVDETLDPARFALLPLTKPRIACGMAAAALVGIPATVTAIVFGASVISDTARGGLLPGLFALVGVIGTLLFCVVGSRALTSALAGALRARRTRDIASVLVAVMAASCGPLQFGASRLVSGSDLSPLARVVHVLGWTPLAAGFAAPFDAANGEWLPALGRLGVLAASVLLAAWWWSTTFEDAMVGVASEGRTANPVSRGGAVAGLVPWWLRRGTVGPFRGIVARELRYWLRDNRRRIALLSAALSGVTLPLIWSLQGHNSPSGGIGLTFSSSFSAWVAGVTMFQVFSMDGTTYATHLLAGVSARTDVRARVTAMSLLTLPVLIILSTVVAILHGAEAQLPLAYGTLLATFGVAVGASTSFAVDGAYPMPEARNPFAMRTGTGTGKGLLMFGVMGLTLVCTAPVFVVAFVAPPWLVLPIGAAWGFAAATAGTAIAAARLSRRGPELLLAVTPRR